MRELLICSASGVPPAPSTQKTEGNKYLWRYQYNTQGVENSQTCPPDRIPSQSPLTEEPSGAPTLVFSRSHLPLDTRCCVKLHQCTYQRTPSPPFGAFSHVSPSISAHAQNFARSEQSGAEEQREAGSADERER